jgi:hypothetical protein
MSISTGVAAVVTILIGVGLSKTVCDPTSQATWSIVLARMLSVVAVGSAVCVIAWSATVTKRSDRVNPIVVVAAVLIAAAAPFLVAKLSPNDDVPTSGHLLAIDVATGRKLWSSTIDAVSANGVDLNTHTISLDVGSFRARRRLSFDRRTGRSLPKAAPFDLTAAEAVTPGKLSMVSEFRYDPPSKRLVRRGPNGALLWAVHIPMHANGIIDQPHMELGDDVLYVLAEGHWAGNRC